MCSERQARNRHHCVVFPGKLLPLLSGKACVQPLLPGCGKERTFISQNLPLSPLANLEAIATDSTMSYGSLLLHQKHVRRNAASSECKVGETGISHTRQSWQERKGRGKKKPPNKIKTWRN